MLAEDAIKAAITDYRTKRSTTNLAGTEKMIGKQAVAEA